MDVAEIAPDLFGDQLVLGRGEPAQRRVEWVDGPAQLHDLALEEVDGFDLDPAAGREDVLFERIDVELHGGGDVDIGVDHMVGHGMHHRGGPQSQAFGKFLELLANPREPCVVTVAHRDHELVACHDHDLAGLDDLVRHL